MLHFPAASTDFASGTPYAKTLIGHPRSIPIVQEGYPVFHLTSSMLKGSLRASVGMTPRSWSRISTKLLAGGFLLGASSLGIVSSARASGADADLSATPASQTLAASAFTVPVWDGTTILASSQGYYPPRYRPQHTTQVVHRQWHRGPDGWLTLRGGFFDTENVPKNDWLAGFKLTGVVSKGVEMGISTDYQRRSNSAGERVDEYRDPAGNLVKTTVPTAEVSSSLVPALGILELRIPTPGLQPYVGAGAGYEWLFVDGDDFVNNTHFSDTFGGFGWQGFGGIDLAINEKARLSAEAFWNQSDVSRHFVDPISGFEVKQQINVRGGGIRGGLSFAF
jgi:hypothetical protein